MERTQLVRKMTDIEITDENLKNDLYAAEEQYRILQEAKRYSHLQSKGTKMGVKWVILSRFLWSLHHLKAIFEGYIMVQSILQAFCYLYFIDTFILYVPLLRIIM